MSLEKSRKYTGIAAAPGLAAGEAYIWRKETLQIPRYTAAQPAAEVERLKAARQVAQGEINRLREKVEADVGAEEAAVFEAHAMFLEDESLVEMSEEAIHGGLNAEAAWMDAIDYFAKELAQIPDKTLSERAADVRDVGRRVLGHLMGKTGTDAPHLPGPVVLVARDLEPSQTASLDKSKVLAFCTAEGGPTAHTAILAKAMGLPAVVGIGADILDLPGGAPVLVDGAAGTVIAYPEPGQVDAFRRLQEEAGRIAHEEQSRAQEPVVTPDGRRIEVVANIGGVADAANALRMGAEGVGLLRTEFLYLERATAPSEAEQYAAYREVLELMEDRPVVVRTLDVGGDKQLAYLDLGKEANPFLGWRAIRMCLDQPDFFKVQLRALLRASPGHDLRIMFPMVSVLDEVRQAKRLLQEAWQELTAGGIPVAEDIQVGIMVEIPSVALMAEHFAREVDFFSIGTNDLTQYTFAAERTNERVAHLGDAIHPAVLRQIRAVIQAAHAAGIWVGVCGELAGDPDAAPILLGLELDEFSMSPGSIPHAKTVLRQWTMQAARDLAEQALALDSAEAVRSFVRAYPIKNA